METLQAKLNLPTPVIAHKLEYYLNGYNIWLKKYLVLGFTLGFKLNNFNFTSIDNDKTLKSAREHPDVVNKKINKELESNRLAGPYESPPYSDPVISPLGVREKKTPGEFRLIHHLSYPYGESVNDGIPRNLASVHYTPLSTAIDKIVQYGRYTYLAKADIKSAFRIIPIHPSDYHLLGFKWEGKYFFDKCLPMGASSSCNIFEKFSSAINWIVQQKCPDVTILHVLDDFLFISNSKIQCQLALDTFLEICQDIGVPIAPEKTVQPTNYLSFLGIDLDTQLMISRIPDDKIVKFMNIIDEFLDSKSVTLRKLQSLTGMLNFTCSVIRPAKTFSRRLYNLTIGVSKPYYKIKLNQQVKGDLRIWKTFLSNYNKKTFFLDHIWRDSNTLQLHTDSCTTIGFGGVFRNKWIYGTWHHSCNKLNITLLELYPICIALYIWGNELSNKSINLFTDNMAVVHIINNFSSKDNLIMILLRHLVLTCMHHNILIKATHIAGRLNTVCDLISRSQVQQARLLAPHLDRSPTHIPEHLLLHKLLNISTN